MNRQLMLENFVKATHGLGRGLFPGMQHQCAYFSENHPGCAIGCQPGFKEKFEGQINVEIGIVDLFDRETSIGKDLMSFFDVKHQDDVDFLDHLQAFHDEIDNWNDDGTIVKEHLDEFCKDEELNNNFSRDNKNEA